MRHDITIRQGETFAWTWTKRDAAGDAVDLTGYSARMAIKVGFDGATEAYLSSGADANGGTITLGGAAGTVALAMTAAQTTALAGDLSYYLFTEIGDREPIEQYVRMIYDLELIDGSGNVTRELEGAVVVQREVTRT